MTNLANNERERWGTKIGLILALAGNAIGLGNLLRFPTKAAENGGGAFMIPYFIALILVGVPLMWMECAIGRMGGAHGRGHTAGMMPLLWKNRIAKYIGTLGVFMPFGIGLYYIYVTSWCLSYSVFSVAGIWFEPPVSYFGLGREEMVDFRDGLHGHVVDHAVGPGLIFAHLFFLVTIFIVFWVLWKGISRGIEWLNRFAVPGLFLLGAILAVRALTLPSHGPGQTVLDGLGFVWNPNFESLKDADVWLAAAGQIFFTLSVGWGIVHTYTSYLRRDDDVALTGLATASLNETAEVVLGGTIALTASVVFFGVAGTQQEAAGGAFNIGFVTLPLILQELHLGEILGMLWFLLLFFAGLTSAVAIMQPSIALLEEDYGLPRRKAVVAVGVACLFLSQPVVFFKKFGFLDELDFWVGTFALVIFGLAETVLFAWIFGLKRGWKEIERGAAIRVPRIFRSILLCVTPVLLACIVGFYLVQKAPEKLLMKDGEVPPESVPYVWAARIFVLALFIGFCILVWAGARRRERLGLERLAANGGNR